MSQLVLWMIMAYGLGNIIVYGKIFNGPRNFIKKWAESPIKFLQPSGKFLEGMTSCMMCVSVWIGFFYGILVYSPTNQLLGVNQWYSWFFDGFLSSGAVWAINSIIEWFEQNRPNNNQIL